MPAPLCQESADSVLPWMCMHAHVWLNAVLSLTHMIFALLLLRGQCWACSLYLWGFSSLWRSDNIHLAHLLHCVLKQPVTSKHCVGCDDLCGFSNYGQNWQDLCLWGAQTVPPQNLPCCLLPCFSVQWTLRLPVSPCVNANVCWPWWSGLLDVSLCKKKWSVSKNLFSVLFNSGWSAIHWQGDYWIWFAKIQLQIDSVAINAYNKFKVKLW